MAHPAFAPWYRRPFASAAAVLLVGSAASVLTSVPVQADTLLVEAVQGEQSTMTERPRRGMSMKNVEARFGAPQNRDPAVGQPPITRWDYADYSVFFEYQHVIHAVPKRGS